MAVNRHEYVVSLDLQTSQASKQSLAALKSAIDDTGGSLDKLGTTYAQLAQYTKDRTVLERQLGDVISNELKKRDDELGQIEAQKVALLTNAESKYKNSSDVSKKIKKIDSMFQGCESVSFNPSRESGWRFETLGRCHAGIARSSFLGRSGMRCG